MIQLKSTQINQLKQFYSHSSWLFLIFNIISLKLQKISLPATHSPSLKLKHGICLLACPLSFPTFNLLFLHLRPNLTLGYNVHISPYSRPVFSFHALSPELIQPSVYLFHLLPVEGKPFFGFINRKSYILTTKLKTITIWIIMCSNHEPSKNQCFQSRKYKRSWPLQLTPSIVPSVVTGELQHTEELWENEFSGYLKC